MDTLLKDILNPNKKVFIIKSDDTLLTAAKLMAENNVGSLLVENGSGKFQGIITERDFAFKVAAKSIDIKNTVVKQIMTPDLITMNHNATAKDAFKVMTQKRIRHLPIYDDNKKFLGLLSIGDLIKHISERYEEKHEEVEHLYQYITQ
ncbi:CBS domain-containing protein [Thiotrichales bacterium 19S9-12]|nr:CBS domain-containing protein [Thiotrichales bacterium 19S9-11]MCF6811179.1 CBS domain-containing protein [Thiotrichales bacterium 19S9-12]